MSDESPSMIAARASWRCVQAHDKQGWLDLMADDVRIEDPIGVAPTNPTGQGLHGKEEVAAFYEANIAPATLRIETEESWDAGLESAHVLKLETTFPNGVVSRVRGVFTYRVDDAGKLTNLRGYWNMGMMQFEQPD